ncbi:hypothetical protein C8R45DRAFT_1094409 [Mycena sanguinolenta]|nr:hypothetical protein C8R45DRAFT_1094409 [Mycena sanguinolenta]
MFLQAGDLSPGEIKAYRSWGFTDVLGHRDNDPFFSVDSAAEWMTSSGYQLHASQEGSAITARSTLENATIKELKAFRSYMLTDKYQTHPFFSLEDPEKWIGPDAFQAYMDAYAEPRKMRADSSPISSRAPSRASSSVSMARSRTSSRISLVPSSRASSPAFYAPSDSVSLAEFSRSGSPVSNFESDQPSRPSSSMSVIEISSDSDDGDTNLLGNLVPPAQSQHSLSSIQPKVEETVSLLPVARVSTDSLAPSIANKRKGKMMSQIAITRQLKVDEIIHLTAVPPTFDVPRKPTAILLDLSGRPDLLTRDGKPVTIDKFVRAENQESWDGSSGHSRGDVVVCGFFPDLKKGIMCRRVDLTCNGIDVCEFLDPALFAGLERYEPDEAAMQELWVHEVDQNEAEAAASSGIIARYYKRIKNSKCKVQCGGSPTLVRLRKPSTYGKNYFIGCSKWTRSEMGLHLYWPVPPNIDEDVLQFVMEHNGRLPDTPMTMNPKCILTVHPRVGLKNCVFSHIINGEIRTAKLKRRPCGSKMLIFVPIKESAETLHKAIVTLRNPHNHPMHPRTKPSAEDRLKLSAAVDAAGLTGLTVQKLLDAPSTSSIYDGKRVTETSPAFTNIRKVRKLIVEKRKVEYPKGTGWDGVLHEIQREAQLHKSQRYIHTAMSKNGFRLVVTMHPTLAMLLHKILSLNIDFTFKRVEGNMNEWEVVGFVDSVEKRFTLASLYCDTQNKEAFTQLFKEFFDAVAHVTGERLKLAPFYPDAKCRVVIMDGEVPQAQGLAAFLEIYNNPRVSGIHTTDETELLSLCLKICNPHFLRYWTHPVFIPLVLMITRSHIEELSSEIPQIVIDRLKSIMGLKTPEQISDWHQFVAAQSYEDVRNWYQHKLKYPWYLHSVNKSLSKIASDDWDITPLHSNYAETAHAARNAETGIHMPLLTAILKSKERDNIKADELALTFQNAIPPKRWNGSANREKLSAQRQIWTARKAAARNDELTSYDSLQKERDAGTKENKASIERGKLLDAEIKTLQEKMKLDRHRTDLRAEVVALRKEVTAELSLRQEWAVRRAEIDKQLTDLRKGGLAGVHINGRRPIERPSGVDNPAPPVNSTSSVVGVISPLTEDANQLGGKQSSIFGSNSHEYSTTEESGNPAIEPHAGWDLEAFDAFLSTFAYTGPPNAAHTEDSANVECSQPSVEWPNSNTFQSQSDMNGLEYIGPATDYVTSSVVTQEQPESLNQTLPVQWPNSDTFQSQLENDDLEYIGPPTDYAASLEDIREWPESLQEPPNVSTNWTALSLSQDLSPRPMPSETSDLSTNWTTRSLSQELPRLPAPPPLSPPPRADEIAIPSGSFEEEDQVASHDINLEFDERNIVSGKRRRTVSSRAADGIALRPTKKGPHSRVGKK